MTFSDQFTSLGCWKDQTPWKGQRVIPQLEGSDPRISDNYETRENAIDKCFQVAKEKGMVIFALQDGGWCAGATVKDAYRTYGAADDCKDGRGGASANSVYLIANPRKMLHAFFFIRIFL